MKWTAALFGHKKPDWYALSVKTGELVAKFITKPDAKFEADNPDVVLKGQDNSRRAKPGDIIAVRPLGHRWTPTEKKEFLIVEIDGLEENQLQGVVEPYWDTVNGYKVYEPLSYNDWYAIQVVKAEKKFDTLRAAMLLEENKERWYQEYLYWEKEKCRFPVSHLYKRRHSLKLTDLETCGVDIEAMTDKDISYVPEIAPIEKEACYDKLNADYVATSAGLSVIKPLTDAELKTATAVGDSG